jgi:hypothetical protein
MCGSLAVRHRSISTLLTSACFALALTGAAFGWGAIAVDDAIDTHPDDVGYGFSTGHNSEAAAASGALDECKDAGNESCKVVLTFKACGAYATSKRKFGVGEGSTKQRAEQAALIMCGQQSCQVVSAECDE